MSIPPVKPYKFGIQLFTYDMGVGVRTIKVHHWSNPVLIKNWIAIHNTLP